RPSQSGASRWARTKEGIMNDNRSLRCRFLVIALLAFAATVAGAGWALMASNTDIAVVPSHGSPPAGLVCFGHVDVESGIVGLSPAQAGRIVSINVRETQIVQTGDVLLRVDDRQAKLRVQQAGAALKAAQVQLDQAKELPGQHRSKLSQQAAAVNVAHCRVL